MTDVARALDRAWSWAASRDFAGFDPYDALRSPALASLHRVLGRPFGILATQLVRRSPVDLRRALGVRPASNAKALGLFLATAARTGRREAAEQLASRLRGMTAPGWDVPCWGYPFPWQARAFYLPANTPTVVATAFVGEALVDAHEAYGDPRDLDAALGACRFVLEKLHRTEDATGACLSYSPLDRSAVYNASILGARLLVRAGVAAGREDLVAEARPLVRYVLARQRDDGSWSYGEASFHGWIDSFHTGFVLDALDLYGRACDAPAARQAVARGARFYAERFFGPAGEPYYYSDRPYPFDVHAAAQAAITLSRLRELDGAYGRLAALVGRFLIDRMLEADGRFIYQIRRTHRVRIPYMRWSQAWGVRGLAALVEAKIDP